MRLRRRSGQRAFESELRENRPQPDPAFESTLVERIEGDGARARRPLLRRGAIAVVAIGVAASFGGIGYASSSTVDTVSATADVVKVRAESVAGAVKRAVAPNKRPVVKASPASDQYQNEKVTICHRTGSGKSVTITVSRSALPAHLAHGDSIGACRS